MPAVDFSSSSGRLVDWPTRISYSTSPDSRGATRPSFSSAGLRIHPWNRQDSKNLASRIELNFPVEFRPKAIEPKSEITFRCSQQIAQNGEMQRLYTLLFLFPAKVCFPKEYFKKNSTLHTVRDEGNGCDPPLRSFLTLGSQSSNGANNAIYPRNVLNLEPSLY